MTATGIGHLGLYGVLTVATAVLAMTFAACAFVYVRRLEDRTPDSLGEGVGVRKKVLDKVRHGEPMSAAELDYATQSIDDCRSPLAFTMPATSFTIGLFYVVGCLYQLHGATPTARVLIGLFPMLGSTNLTIQLLRVARLKKRLRTIAVTEPEEPAVLQPS